MRHGIGLRGLAAATTFALIVVIAANGAPAAAKAADATLVTCIGTQTTNYSPGLLLTNQTVHKSGTNEWPLCTGSTQGITSASSPFDVPHIQLSCISPLGSGAGTQVITWVHATTAPTSTFEWTSTRSVLAGQAVTILTGTITAGLFAGSSAQQIIVAPQLNLLGCLLPPGVTEETGTSTLVITAA
ncbi:hypothetical protein [Micromonospora sp. HUAS LYJ1]|uniref:hypothetical protein n=1 Tax=Micromonospora sp. HUAS LYJ1 TaxID=3061626 RepID=UPI002672748E|nr:hypothetical protein [Micromonospora sp. HUAS LYJ1]WKU05507.1 hypothetical protein Q2K16_00080 [Micromonospora sp. HUAS LYJ1]